MAKIVCEKCKTEYTFKVGKDLENCPVCGASMMGDDNSGHDELPAEDDKNIEEKASVEKKTYYYYNSGTLTDTLYSHRKPVYTFQATDMEDAERQLKEVCPNSPLLKSTPSKQIRCPRCFGTEYTLLNKGYSLFTGFLGSGRVKRVCNYCKKEF